MYKISPVTVWKWSIAVPGQIPDQAVKFIDSSHNATLYVATATRNEQYGVFTSNGSCADYFDVCKEEFYFLVLTHGESTETLAVCCRLSCFPVC